jgi:hypothetical protein
MDEEDDDEDELEDLEFLRRCIKENVLLILNPVYPKIHRSLTLHFLKRVFYKT